MSGPPTAAGEGGHFTLRELKDYLRTNFTHLYRACDDAGVKLRYEAFVPAGHPYDRRLRVLPLTAKEAGEVLRAFHANKAIRRGRLRSTRG